MLEPEKEFWAGVKHAASFFMGNSDVQRALEKLIHDLEDAGLPYAIAGAMALNEHGYRRVTVGVDVLMTRESLAPLKERYLGRGYLEKFPRQQGPS